MGSAMYHSNGMLKLYSGHLLTQVTNVVNVRLVGGLNRFGNLASHSQRSMILLQARLFGHIIMNITRILFWALLLH